MSNNKGNKRQMLTFLTKKRKLKLEKDFDKLSLKLGKSNKNHDFPLKKGIINRNLKTHNYNTRSCKNKSFTANKAKYEENEGNVEYTKSLINALKVAIDENEKLRELVKDLNEENRLIKNENTEQVKALLELTLYHDDCQNNHLPLIKSINASMNNQKFLRSKLKKNNENDEKVF